MNALRTLERVTAGLPADPAPGVLCKDDMTVTRARTWPSGERYAGIPDARLQDAIKRGQA